MDEKALKEWLVEKIEEIRETVHQHYGLGGTNGCPFCCQGEYPANGDVEGYGELEEAGLEAEEYHIDHDDDCLVTVLDHYAAKIREHGLW